jgi:peptide/nickel transport system ATP-binding protein
VTLAETELTALSEQALRQQRTRMQIIFQDPIASLNPRRKIADIIAEPLMVWRASTDRDLRESMVAEAMASVGLDMGIHGQRRRREFSGGQCQRVAIARALIMRPELLICDEAVSSLDVSVQAQILNLLEELKVRFGLTMVFISHDLSVVHHVADRIAVMYLGRLCEIGDARSIFNSPKHPYTKALLSSIPSMSARTVKDAARLPGSPPSPLQPPSGCRFRTRCSLATARCAEVQPAMLPLGADHMVACHNAMP